MTLLAVLQTVGILLAGIAAVLGLRNRHHIRALHIELNSRLSELIASTRAAGIGEGIAQERDHMLQERQREAAP